MKDNFDVHEWNLNRYKETINEIDIDDYTDKNVNSDEENSSFNITRGGDDAKMGAEEESDANVVGEGLNDRISKINIGYTEQGRLYGVKIEDASGKRLGKLAQDDFNGLLKMLNINDEIPFKMSFGDEDILDNIVKQLQDQGIDASWDDVMDVS
jgi:hypothetical protein|tara:strand:- start:381 stop:842 length:462 start_codon:yes stop_codon:yes gene_type:complete